MKVKDGVIRSQRELEKVTQRLGSLQGSFLAVRSIVSWSDTESVHQPLPLNKNLQESCLYFGDPRTLPNFRKSFDHGRWDAESTLLTEKLNHFIDKDRSKLD